MRLVTYNIQFSRGKDDEYDVERIAGEVLGADIIALQEVECNWRRSGLVDQAARLAECLSDYYWVYRPAFDVDASQTAGEKNPKNHRRQFGNMLLSKSPILEARLLNLPRVHYPNMFNFQQGALETVVNHGGRSLRIFCIHLGYGGQEERHNQIAFLFQHLKYGLVDSSMWSGPAIIDDEDWTDDNPLCPTPASTIWMGDFNLTPDSDAYASIVKGTDSVEGFVDAWSVAGSGIDKTWRATDRALERHGYPTERSRRLDYIFVSPNLASNISRAWVDVDARGSDHQPVWLEFD